MRSLTANCLNKRLTSRVSCSAALFNWRRTLRAGCESPFCWSKYSAQNFVAATKMLTCCYLNFHSRAFISLCLKCALHVLICYGTCEITVEPLYNGHTGDRRKWTRLKQYNECMDCVQKNGRCREVTVEERRPLWRGGRCREVAIVQRWSL